jgi:cytochrome c5
MKTLIMTGAFAIAAAMLPIVAEANAQSPIDAHQVYEQKCAKCHFEHAADLGRLKLEMAGDVLKVARSGKSVDKLLGNHHAVTLSAEEKQALMELMRNGIRWAGVFQHRCASCHRQASTFARETLEMKEGALVVKRDGTDVRQLLTRHGEPTAAEIETLVDMLAYQVRTGQAR